MSKVREFVTPIGILKVVTDGVSVTVGLSCPTPERLRYKQEVADGVPQMTYWLGKRQPRLGDEVTQGGRTFEVTGLRSITGGRVQVRDDLGFWENWEEK